MSTLDYQKRITVAAQESREAIALLSQMIREGQPPADILAVVDRVAENVNTFETEAGLITDGAAETAIALVHAHQQRDKAYRDRDAMNKLLRQYQEDHQQPKPSAADLKKSMEQKQAARERDKKNKKTQLSLFD